MGKKYILAIFSIVLIVSTTFAEEWKNEGFSEKVNCIANFKDKIYAGTDNGLLVIESASGKKVLYNKSNSGISDNKVSHLAIDKQGLVWIASSNYGLSSFDGSKWKVYLTPKNDRYITALSVDAQGVASIGYQVSCGEGYHCNPGNAQVLKFKADKEATYFPPCNGAIQAMVSDAVSSTYLLRGKFFVKVGAEFNMLEVNIVDSSSDMLLMNERVWIATSKGLKVYQNKTFTTVDASNSPLPDNAIKKLFADAYNNLFVITSTALVQKSKDDWKSFPLSELPSKHISGVLTDASGKIWVGASNGLYTRSAELQASSDTTDGHSFLLLPNEDALLKNRMQIYPNPSNGTFSVEVPEKYNTLAVYNTNGGLVHTQAVTASLQDVFLPGLAKGVYQVQLASGKAHLESKILIE